MSRIPKTCRVEIAIVAVVFAVASFGGGFYLARYSGTPFHDYNNPDGRDFLPAAMWAAGHGFGCPYPNSYPAPGLEDFLYKRTMTWDDTSLAADAALRPVTGKFMVDRLYLLYFVAISWRIFGLSWYALSISMALVFGLTAALVYGIFRIGANRATSVAGMFLFAASPLVLLYLPSMRDFFRGPPILAAMLICGILIVRKPTLRRFLALSVLLGGVIGIGVGFRQDAVICLPPAIATLALFARGREPIRWPYRLLAMVLLLFAFLIPAAPSLTMTRDTGGNNSFYLLQGFSDFSLNDLQTKPASYVPFYSHSDYAVHAEICAFDNIAHEAQRNAWNRGIQCISGSLAMNALAMTPVSPLEGALSAAASIAVPRWRRDRGLDIWNKASEETGRAMLQSLLKTFPADFVTRWYSAVSLTLRDSMVKRFGESGMLGGNGALNALFSWQRPVATHFERWGFWYCLASFIVMSMVDFRLALACFFFLLYFAGYPSLSFQYRAAIHLQFIPFFFLAFLISSAFNIVYALLSKRERHGLVEKWSGIRMRAWRALRRMAFFWVFVSLSLAVPYYGARFAQERTVASLLERYSRAELEPLRWEETVRTDEYGIRTIVYRPLGIPYSARRFSPADSFLRKYLPYLADQASSIHAEYLVADIEPMGDGANITLEYESKVANLNYIRFIRKMNGEDSKSYRYFFPVYDFSPEFQEDNTITTFSPFNGIVMDANNKLKALYRVRNRNEFPILMNVLLPEEPEAIRKYIGLTPPFVCN